MFTRRLYLSLGWLIALCLFFGGAANAHYTGGPAELVSGKADKRDKFVVDRTIEKILEVTTDPEKLDQLLVPSLQLSQCFKLSNGAERCDYWDPVRGGGAAISLVDIHLISLSKTGDSGGTAFWDVRNDMCIAADAIRGFGVPRVQRASLPSEPFADGEVLELTTYSFPNLNPGWGKVDLTIRVRNNCATGFELRLVKGVG